MYPINSKTIFVLDGSPVFASVAEKVEFDFHKTRANVQNYVSSEPLSKTMWTCATESVLEYCRIVWDIFPGGEKLLRFVVNGESDVECIGDWDAKEQSCHRISHGLAVVGRPREAPSRRKGASKGISISTGLHKALELVAELTPAQREAMAAAKAQEEADGSGPQNRGRIVLLTHVLDDKKLRAMVDSVQEHQLTLNKRLHGSDGNSKAPITQLHLEIVHCHTDGPGAPIAVTTRDTRIDLSSSFSYQVFTADAGTGLSKKLLFMALCHYHLASTTVTGIPMKEEQNASSSANYDVELFHRAEAHSNLGESADQMQTTKEGCEYKTITLKWHMAKGSPSDMHHVTCAVRVTPTDVNSRPSSCLTNFLLGGRSVMLEMPIRKPGSTTSSTTTSTKSLSHMLTSHGGEIFIHNLTMGRSLLEDPPGISEGAGGRVTDYRIPDGGNTMKTNRLAPYGTPTALATSRARLARHTLVCPMTISATTIFNMATLENLQRITLEPDMTEEEMTECQKTIFTLLSMENKGETLPVPAQTTSAGKVKTLKKDEQYKVMFAELERFLGAHASNSDYHRKVLDCLLEVRGKPPSIPTPAGKSNVELDVALHEIERYDSMTEREKLDFNMKDGVLRSTTETPMSPPHMAGGGKRPAFGGGMNGKTLSEVFLKRMEKENSLRTDRKLPFEGQRSIGEKAKLYLNFERKEAAAAKEQAIAMMKRAGTPERMQTD